MAGRYVWSNVCIRQRLADTADWSRSVLYGAPARTDGTQLSDGRSWLDGSNEKKDNSGSVCRHCADDNWSGYD